MINSEGDVHFYVPVLTIVKNSTSHNSIEIAIFARFIIGLGCVLFEVVVFFVAGESAGTRQTDVGDDAPHSEQKDVH